MSTLKRPEQSVLQRLTTAWSLSLLLGAALPASASSLGDKAAQLAAGGWTVLDRAGDSSGFNYNLIVACNGTDCGDNVLNYADKGVWNPNTREMHFIGKGHLRETKHLSYSEATDRWSLEAKPPFDCGSNTNCYGLGHGFEHTTMNPATGDIYARLFNSVQFYKWTRATKAWSRLPDAPNTAVALAIEYFPEMGGLVQVGGGQLHVYRESTQAWSQLAQGLTMGPYSNVATYNPVHKIVVFGGGNSGNRELYRVAASGAVTAIPNAPVAVGVQSSVFTVDPASGRYLLFGSAGGFYDYDPATNRWATLSTANLPLFRSGSNATLYRVAIPISTHGVVAILAEDGTSNTRVMLYRHAASPSAPAPDTTPPSPPSGLTVQ